MTWPQHTWCSKRLRLPVILALVGLQINKRWLFRQLVSFFHHFHVVIALWTYCRRTSSGSWPALLPNLEALACLTLRFFMGYRGTMRCLWKKPLLCLLLNRGLWHKCSFRKCGRPRCSWPFWYKYRYSPVSSSSTYCPQSRDSISYVRSVMSLHCSRIPHPTLFSSLTILSTGSACVASVSTPTSPANPSFMSSATTATSASSPVVASTKLSTSLTVSASSCLPSDSTLGLYVGSLRSKLPSSQLNNGCFLQGMK